MFSPSSFARTIGVAALSAITLLSLSGSTPCKAADAQVYGVTVTFGGTPYGSSWSNDFANVLYSFSWTSSGCEGFANGYYKNRYTNPSGGLVNQEKIRVASATYTSPSTNQESLQLVYDGHGRTVSDKPTNDGTPAGTVSTGTWWYTGETSILDSSGTTIATGSGASSSTFIVFPH